MPPFCDSGYIALFYVQRQLSFLPFKETSWAGRQAGCWRLWTAALLRCGGPVDPVKEPICLILQFVTPDCFLEEKGVDCCGKNEHSTFKNNWLKSVINSTLRLVMLSSFFPWFCGILIFKKIRYFQENFGFLKVKIMFFFSKFFGFFQWKLWFFSLANSFPMKCTSLQPPTPLTQLNPPSSKILAQDICQQDICQQIFERHLQTILSHKVTNFTPSFSPLLPTSSEK